MRCAFCGNEMRRPELHAHLVDDHAEEVKTWETGSGRRFYQLECPDCDESTTHQVKPRLTDPSFLEEYSREIRIVAFDEFLYHVEAAHEGVNDG